MLNDRSTFLCSYYAIHVDSILFISGRNYNLEQFNGSWQAIPFCISFCIFFLYFLSVFSFFIFFCIFFLYFFSVFLFFFLYFYFSFCILFFFLTFFLSVFLSFCIFSVFLSFFHREYLFSLLAIAFCVVVDNVVQGGSNLWDIYGRNS